ncbi:MAG TPA: OmpA family protein [Vicinamibacteria bacterium]|nr:OmpA family protein [Vicinamibacteria bacterium]
MPSTTLSLQDRAEREEVRDRPAGLIVLVLLLLAGVGALGYLAWEGRQRTAVLEQQVVVLTRQAQQSEAAARKALERAASAETSARQAAEGRLAAEAQTETARQETQAARQEADTAKQEASSARETAAQAQAEAERIRKRAEAEVNRLEQSLGQIADTRRTALGLVMNLGSDYLKFEFDKADLRPEDRELLSRVAGILMTSQDYTLTVAGHTDDVGSEAYNQALSVRRAQAVRDYLVDAGLPAAIFTVEGYGKSRPLVRGTSDEARRKNRRVELGLAHTHIRYGR